MYKVADGVTTHEGWGLGSCFFSHVDPTIRQDHGFEAPGQGAVTGRPSARPTVGRRIC